MTCRVVTIAMSTGARAPVVARQVADQLGFVLVSDEILDWAAEYAGVSRQVVEEVEHSRPLTARIADLVGSDNPAKPEEPAAATEPETSPAYRRLIQAIIREVADRGNVVILAHGAGMLLAGTPGVLRVLITGSPETRAARIATPDESPADAMARVAYSDSERAAYFRRFYNLDAELPTHYDLVVNTDALTAETAARAIVCAARG